MNLSQNLRFDASALRSKQVGFMQGSVLLTPTNQLQWNPFQPKYQEHAINIQASWIVSVKRYKRQGEWTASIQWQAPGDADIQPRMFFSFGKGDEGDVGHTNRERFCELVQSVVVGATAAAGVDQGAGASSSRPTPVTTHASASATGAVPISRKRSMSSVGIATDTASRTAGATTTTTPTTQMSGEHMRGKAYLLSTRPELKELQTQLIDSNVVTEEQFWQGREGLADLGAAQQAQETGVPSSFGLEVPKVEKVSFNVTKQIMKQIFFECPPVHAAYVANVPEKMTEESFWTMYFHSKYYHRERAPEEAAATGGGQDAESKANQEMDSAFLERQRKEANAEQLFGFDGDDDDDNEGTLEQERAREQLDKVDAEINLVATDNDMPVRTADNNPHTEARGSAGVWNRDPAAARQDKLMRETLRRKRARGVAVDSDALHAMAVRPIAPQPVVNKYNRHGTRVLATQQSASSQAATSITASQSAAARQRGLTKEDQDPIAYDLTRFDRETATREGFAKLNLKGLNQFDAIGGGGGGAAKGLTTSATSQGPESNQDEETDATAKARQIESVTSLLTWRRNGDDAFPDRATTMAVLKDLAENTTAAASEQLKLHGQSSRRVKDLDVTFRDNLMRLFNAACELCRHFWAAAKRRDGLNKMERVHDKMKELTLEIETERTEIRAKGKGAEAMILLSIIEQLQSATEALGVRRGKVSPAAAASGLSAAARLKKTAPGAGP